MDSLHSDGPPPGGSSSEALRTLTHLAPETTDRTEAFAALQTGVLIPLPEVKEDLKVERLIRNVLGIDKETFDREVKTIMLNRRVVDEPESTTLASGDVLIVSGAMPGLVGAMLRSDSPIKAMRESISGNSGSASQESDTHPGFLFFKAFNTVLSKYLGAILKYGVFREDLDDE